MQLENQAQSIHICLVGAFPPPIHGVSLVNSTIRDRLFDREVHPACIDLSPRSLERTWSIRLSRIVKVFIGLSTYFKALLNNKNVSLYIGLSGSYGQLYEILFIVLARLFYVRIFLHHHSYAYLGKWLPYTHLLVRLAGLGATHIVLCDGMGRKLQDRYKPIQHIFVLSNAVTLQCNSTCFIGGKKALKTIAYLGNITPEKGIFEFLAVTESLVNQGIEVQALIAGPFLDEATQTIVLDRVSCLNAVEYLGPKYDKEKVDFYKKVDVLLFPTKYQHEAEPLTIHEAMSYGIPVIAWERGCIKSILTSDVGLVIEQTEDFVSEAVERIKLWQASPQSYQTASSTALERFLTTKTKYTKRFDELLSMMIGSS